MNLLLSFLAALCFTLGGVFMKHADGVRNLPAVAGFIAIFAVGAILQSLVMRGNEMGATYVVILGVEAVLAFGLGMAMFGETMTLAKGLAALMIVGGIAVLRST